MSHIRNHNTLSDEHLYESIFYRYQGLVFSYLSGRIQNRDDMMDVMQEVFTHLWDKGDILNTDNPDAIIFNTCKQKVASFYRRTSKQPYYDSLQVDIPDMSLDEIDDKVSYEIDLDKVNEGIGMLPERRREILILNKLEGIPQQEIAERLNMSRSAVENQISKAITFLKKKLFDS
ncbi:hypothetical protein BBI01_06695 [Chryseobacterium artocarpi]|uniref:RNA polymerase sigma factor 70 region 4 type 2 domain-containing protein n=1 Tax=Chryseobacterium artocarpi TaxID=1414727 RepID=A0A1B8ZXS0_9FLAO|nr:sigma-70 family RNA polymerase sigma factor [Chryseobacterium artocarpi]OCA76375.1 hypothetical protein BBI01_06695 [Chryseobacterium artocarpi]